MSNSVLTVKGKKFHIDKRLFRSKCPVCHKLYWHKKINKSTCSNKCRQKKYRLDHGHAANPKEAAQRQIRTKREQRRTFECLWCRKLNLVDGLQAKRLYCNDKCQQRAYRHRNADLIRIRKLEKEKPDKSFSSNLEHVLAEMISYD